VALLSAALATARLQRRHRRFELGDPRVANGQLGLQRRHFRHQLALPSVGRLRGHIAVLIMTVIARRSPLECGCTRPPSRRLNGYIVFASSRFEAEALLEAFDTTYKSKIVVGSSPAGEFTGTDRGEGTACVLAIRSDDLRFAAGLGRSVGSGRAQASRELLASCKGVDSWQYEEAGFDAHLLKPVDLADLQRLLVSFDCSP